MKPKNLINQEIKTKAKNLQPKKIIVINLPNLLF